MVMFIISTASSLVVSIESNVVVVSISFGISFSLTDKTPLAPDVAVVHVITVVRVVVVVSVIAVSRITIVPSVITITHGIVSVSTVPVVPSILSISFCFRLSKDREDKEGCKNL